MIEKDTIAGIDAEGLSVIHHDPVRVELGYGVRAARVERRSFLLRNLLHQAVQLAGAGLVETGFFLQAQDANGLQQAQGADCVYVCGVFRAFETHRHMAHGAQVIDLVWLSLLHDADEIAGVGQVAVVEFEVRVVDVWVLVDVVDAPSVEQAAPALDTVDDVALFEQKFGKIGAVLTSDAGYERDF